MTAFETMGKLLHENPNVNGKFRIIHNDRHSLTDLKYGDGIIDMNNIPDSLLDEEVKRVVKEVHVLGTDFFIELEK
jgi:hypothetical protein